MMIHPRHQHQMATYLPYVRNYRAIGSYSVHNGPYSILVTAI